MNQVLDWLSEGDIRSDGLYSEVVSLVLKTEQLYKDLLGGINIEDDLIRGRAADALEKVARSRLDLLVGDIVLFINSGQEGVVPNNLIFEGLDFLVHVTLSNAVIN